MINKTKKILSSIFAATMGLTAVVAVPVAMTSCALKSEPKIAGTMSADSWISDDVNDLPYYMDSGLIFTFVPKDAEIGKLDPMKMRVDDVKLTLENGSTKFTNISGGDDLLKLTGISVIHTDFRAKENVVSYNTVPKFEEKEDGSVEMRCTQVNKVSEVVYNNEWYSFVYDKEGGLANKMKVSAEITMSYDGEDPFSIKVPTQTINVGPNPNL